MKGRRWRHAALIGLCALTVLLMLSVPHNRYEWMLQAPTLAGEHLTHCSLPLDDGEPALHGFLYLLPLLVVATIGSAMAARRGSGWPPSLGYALLALGFWTWRFVVAAPVCP